jgi:tRNA (cmo5U34)-methyltransferase
VFSIFTVQFLPEADKLPLLHRMYEALLPGGALIIAEKILASSARLQDALTFPFYDRKLRYFSAEDILDKERKLRGQMTLWSEGELKSRLNAIGFSEIQNFWTGFPFMAIVAVKQI